MEKAKAADIRFTNLKDMLLQATEFILSFRFVFTSVSSCLALAPPPTLQRRAG